MKEEELDIPATAIVTKCRPDGSIKYKYSCIQLIGADIFHGPYEEFYESGRRHSKLNYWNGQRDGKQTFYKDTYKNEIVREFWVWLRCGVPYDDPGYVSEEEYRLRLMEWEANKLLE